MKFIHTADWHLGNKMHDIDRFEEYNEFFKWLKETIIAENAETLVVSGDIYDTAHPPVDATKQFYRFLASLLDTSCKNVIIVGGNHDSGALLDASKDLMEALNMHVVGTMINCEIKDTIFKLYDENQNVNGICVALPFIKDSELRNYYDESKESKEGTLGDVAIKKIYDEALEEAKKVRGDLNVPIIATGHLYAANLEGRYAGMDTHEKQDDGVRVIDVVGTLGSIHVGSFSDEYDYVALGHIHYSTKVGGNKKVTYSGSPFVMGFDEANMTHHIHSVECVKGSDVVVKKIDVPETYHYECFTGDSETLKKQLLELSGKYDDDKKIYVEVRYLAADSSLVNQMLDDIELPDSVYVVSNKIIKQNKSKNVIELGTKTMREMQNLDPEEIFRKLIMDKLGISLSSEEDNNENDTAEKNSDLQPDSNEENISEENINEENISEEEKEKLEKERLEKERLAKEEQENKDRINMLLGYFLEAYNKAEQGGDNNENN